MKTISYHLKQKDSITREQCLHGSGSPKTGETSGWGLQRLSPVKDRPLELDPRQALLVVAIGEARDMIHPTQIGSWDCDGRQVA